MLKKRPCFHSDFRTSVPVQSGNVETLVDVQLDTVAPNQLAFPILGESPANSIYKYGSFDDV